MVTKEHGLNLKTLYNRKMLFRNKGLLPEGPSHPSTGFVELKPGTHKQDEFDVEEFKFAGIFPEGEECYSPGAYVESDCNGQVNLDNP